MFPRNVAGRLHGTRAGDPVIRVVMAYVSRNAVPPNRLSSLLSEMGRTVATIRSRRLIGEGIATASSAKPPVLARR